MTSHNPLWLSTFLPKRDSVSIFLYNIKSCFSFFSARITLTSTFNVCAAIAGGVSASHCVSEMSATRSDLYISIHTRSSVWDVFSM